MNSRVIEMIEKNGSRFLYRNGALMSIDPPESGFGYFVWSHLIPPFKPEHTLILGYGGGTCAELMRKIWGDQLKITGVDLEPHDYKYKEYRIKVMTLRTMTGRKRSRTCSNPSLIISALMFGTAMSLVILFLTWSLLLG